MAAIMAAIMANVLYLNNNLVSNSENTSVEIFNKPNGKI